MKDSTQNEKEKEYALKKLGEFLDKCGFDQAIAGLYDKYHMKPEEIHTFTSLHQAIWENGEKEGRREIAEKVMAALSPYLPRS